MDIWLFVCQLFTFVALVEYAVVNVKLRSEADLRKQDEKLELEKQEIRAIISKKNSITYSLLETDSNNNKGTTDRRRKGWNRLPDAVVDGKSCSCRSLGSNFFLLILFVRFKLGMASKWTLNRHYRCIDSSKDSYFA